MPFLVFKTCCGFARLRTGCFIIAYLLLVLHILNVFLLLLIATKVIVLSKIVNDLENPLGKDPLLSVSVMPITVCLIAIAFLIVLLIGLYKYKRNLLLAFLIGISILIVLDVVTLIFVAAIGGAWILILIRVIALVVDIYVLLVIRSYYYHMAGDNALDTA